MIEVLSDDGSYTAYSKEYDEHYHSTKDGALKESLLKHIYPAFKVKQHLCEINILDICYGLGFTTLSTLHYHKSSNLSSKLNIYSPELDDELIASLKDFTYPKEFEEFKQIIQALSDNGIYDDEFYHIEIFLGDAREYVKRFDKKFDIIYQDAFSPSSNPALWTLEYFEELSRAIKDDGVITTYSIALATRLAMFKNGFRVYLNSITGIRDATISSKVLLDDFKEVDMLHKISCNKDVRPLRD